MDEQKGIEAIIYLQSLARVPETEEEAKAGWNAMSDSEKAVTLKMYEIFTQGDNEND